MNASTRSAETEGELRETVAALRARVDDLEKVVSAVGGEVGVGRSWPPCPACDDGVLLVGDRRAACTDCGHVRPL